MGLPNIQIRSHASEIQVFWDVTPGVSYYNVYLSNDGRPGTFTEIKPRVPNTPAAGRKTLVEVSFLRSSISKAESDTFFLAIDGVDPYGNVIPMGSTRMVPANVDQMVDAGAMNSPITASENMSTAVGATPLKLTLTQDVKFLEVFNNSDEESLYVEVSGVPADRTRSMPVRPGVYYTIFRNISKDTGISLISSGGEVDARIVVHY
jgi:hypothetical protein